MATDKLKAFGMTLIITVLLYSAVVFFKPNLNMSRFHGTLPLLSNENMVNHVPLEDIHVPVNYETMKPRHCSVEGMRSHCTSPQVKQYLGEHQSHVLKRSCYPVEITLRSVPIEDKAFLEGYEMLEIEKETLHQVELTNLNDTASAEKSLFTLQEPGKQYKVGDVINVRIDLIDGASRPRQKGGDDIRIWMVSKDREWKISGEVLDLKNGSYLGSLKAMWEGMATILGAVPYTREMIGASLNWRRQYKSLFYYYGIFQTKAAKERTICSMYATIPGYTKLCNFTSMNYGYPCYCGQPLNTKLSCDDFVLLNDFDFTEVPVTAPIHKLYARQDTKVMIGSNIKLYIKKEDNVVKRAKMNCNKLSPRETWDTKLPTGYFQGPEWKLFKCHNSINQRSMIECLRNTTLIIYGDSTTRQWYTHLFNIIKCNQTTEKWSSKKWYDRSVCNHDALNFTLIWSPHVFPFVRFIKLPTGKTNLKSAVATLDELPSTGKIIFVMHYWCHFMRQHYTLYWDFIKTLKNSIRNALKRNKQLKIAFKSPHVFYKTECPSLLNDLQGKIFIHLLQKEMEEFKDSVLYLNYWDMNTAVENGPIHPVAPVVWENLRLLFGFVCR